MVEADIASLPDEEGQVYVFAFPDGTDQRLLENSAVMLRDQFDNARGLVTEAEHVGALRIGTASVDPDSLDGLEDGFEIELDEPEWKSLDEGLKNVVGYDP